MARVQLALAAVLAATLLICSAPAFARRSHMRARAKVKAEAKTEVQAMSMSQLEAMSTISMRDLPKEVDQSSDEFVEMESSVNERMGLQIRTASEVSAQTKPGLAILVISQGSVSGGESSSIKINDKELSRNGVGFNVVVVNPDNGQVHFDRSYNTKTGSDQVADDMARDIQSVPSGYYVLISIRGSGKEHLTENAIKAIEGCGGEDIRIIENGSSYALIGRKGSPPGAGNVRENVNLRDKAGVTWTQQPGPERGDRGNVGVPGDEGPGGVMGPPGDEGDIGARGSIGPVGEDGQPGFVGPEGEIGDRGPIGPRGLQGYEGGQGWPGMQGDPGRHGVRGPKGETGDPGKMGPKGDTGSPGEKGEQGPIGEVGPNGVQGERGPQGLQGDKGDQGISGKVGEDGDQGLPFNDWAEVEKLEEDTEAVHKKQLELKERLHRRHLKLRIKLASMIKTEAMADEVVRSAKERAYAFAHPSSTVHVVAGYVAGAAAAGAAGASKTEAVPDLLNWTPPVKGIGLMPHFKFLPTPSVSASPGAIGEGTGAAGNNNNDNNDNDNNDTDNNDDANDAMFRQIPPASDPFADDMHPIDGTQDPFQDEMHNI